MNDWTSVNARLKLSILIAATVVGAALAISFGLQSRWNWSAAALALTGITLAGQQGGWYPRIGGLVFVASAAFVVVALWRGGLNLWPLLATAAALVHWDLDHFQRRLVVVDHVEEAPELITQHLRRLLTTVGLGLGLGITALVVRVDYGIGVTLLLSVFVAIGLTQAIRLLRTESD